MNLSYQRQTDTSPHKARNDREHSPKSNHQLIRDASNLEKNLQLLTSDFVAAVKDPSDLQNGLDLLNHTYNLSVTTKARTQLKQNPLVKPLIEERYWGKWHKIDEFLAFPKDSLGYAYGAFLKHLGGSLPEPQLNHLSESEDHYLHRRIRHTHDLWHVILKQSFISA